MSATQADQPAGQAGAPPVPMTLRAIAAWLEANPVALELMPAEVEIHDHLYWPDKPVVVRYYANNAEKIATMMSTIGGDWVDTERLGFRHYRHAITPHAVIDMALRVDGS